MNTKVVFMLSAVIFLLSSTFLLGEDVSAYSIDDKVSKIEERVETLQKRWRGRTVQYAGKPNLGYVPVDIDGQTEYAKVCHQNVYLLAPGEKVGRSTQHDTVICSAIEDQCPTSDECYFSQDYFSYPVEKRQIKDPSSRPAGGLERFEKSFQQAILKGEEQNRKKYSPYRIEYDTEFEDSVRIYEIVAEKDGKKGIANICVGPMNIYNESKLVGITSSQCIAHREQGQLMCSTAKTCAIRNDFYSKENVSIAGTRRRNNLRNASLVHAAR